MQKEDAESITEPNLKVEKKSRRTKAKTKNRAKTEQDGLRDMPGFADFVASVRDAVSREVSESEIEKVMLSHPSMGLAEILTKAAELFGSTETKNDEKAPAPVPKVERRAKKFSDISKILPTDKICFVVSHASSHPGWRRALEKKHLIDNYDSLYIPYEAAGKLDARGLAKLDTSSIVFISNLNEVPISQIKDKGFKIIGLSAAVDFIRKFYSTKVGINEGRRMEHDLRINSEMTKLASLGKLDGVLAPASKDFELLLETRKQVAKPVTQDESDEYSLAPMSAPPASVVAKESEKLAPATQETEEK